MSLGLFATLEMSKRSLDTARAGIELTGHNLANISNRAYARQRLKIETSDAIASNTGPQGTGAKVAGIEAVRSRLLDNQIIIETGVAGYLEAKQKALEFGEVNLGQRLDRQASTPEGTAAAEGVGGQFGLVEGLNEFFSSFQSLSTSPNSTADRQVVLLKTQNLSEKFKSVSTRLARLRQDLNTSVNDDLTEANTLLKQVADLSKSITGSELGGVGNANDLRDRRQQTIEDLAKIINVQTTTDTVTNTTDVTVAGVTVISANNQVEDLESFTDALGGFQVRTNNRATAATTNLTLTSGSAKGTIDARDGSIATLISGIDTLAGTLITAVNTLHTPGFALDGTSTGQAFFTGTKAADITINTVLSQDVNRIQASANGDAGNNGVALSIAQLENQTQTTLGGLTLTESYNQSVANFGQALHNVNNQSGDQKAVNRLMESQRDSLGGVSVDEEMANLVIFQRAFQANAKMISTIDELLQNVLNLSR